MLEYRLFRIDFVSGNDRLDLTAFDPVEMEEAKWPQNSF
jgi:hypothetical protein